MSTEKAPVKQTNEEDLKEMHEFFRDRIDKLKELKTITETRLKDIQSRNPDGLARAEYVAQVNATMLWYLVEVYEMFDHLVDGVFEIDADLTKIDKEFRKHKPTLGYMKRAMKHTKETVQGNK
jgi:hypothetical protein